MNKSCHYCRRTITRYPDTKYFPCSSCKKAHCKHCLVENGISISVAMRRKWQCPCCQDNCCCSYRVCNINHGHCFTYRRTIDRHAKVCPVWTKAVQESRSTRTTATWWKTPEAAKISPRWFAAEITGEVVFSLFDDENRSRDEEMFDATSVLVATVVTPTLASVVGGGN